MCVIHFTSAHLPLPRFATGGNRKNTGCNELVFSKWWHFHLIGQIRWIGYPGFKPHFCQNSSCLIHLIRRKLLKKTRMEISRKVRESHMLVHGGDRSCRFYLMLNYVDSSVIVKHQCVEISQNLKNNAIRGDSWECIIFVKFHYPEVFNSYKILKPYIKNCNHEELLADNNANDNETNNEWMYGHISLHVKSLIMKYCRYMSNDLPFQST